MESANLSLPPGKKIFFASDFHLGTPTYEESRKREERIVAWLDQITPEAAHVFLMGDIFDFWFEYRHAIPKGFVRLQGKIASMCDAGIPVTLFTGNHDMWMFDYLPRELGVHIHREPMVLKFPNRTLLIGHGDGLGPGDHFYKILKRFFDSRICQWLFARIHPNFGIAIAKYWSGKSRISNLSREEKFRGEENEFLLAYCRQMEQRQHHDYYIFGHRHLPLTLQVGDHSTYINLGEWVHFASYASYDGTKVELHEFKS